MFYSGFIFLFIFQYFFVSPTPQEILISDETTEVVSDPRFVGIVINPTVDKVQLYWKKANGEPYRSIQNLKTHLEGQGKRLRFAMNGGMYKPDPTNEPQGLFIEEGVVQVPIDTSQGKGNFYLQPNGVFFITDKNVPVIVPTREYVYSKNIRYATQSGPLLLIDGEFHPSIVKGSANVYVRNGVGVLPDKRLVFAISTQPVNFYDFAEYFKKLGCTDALYLDGAISKMYLPEEKQYSVDGDFGVIISVTK